MTTRADRTKTGTRWWLVVHWRMSLNESSPDCQQFAHGQGQERGPNFLKRHMAELGGQTLQSSLFKVNQAVSHTVTQPVEALQRPDPFGVRGIQADVYGDLLGEPKPGELGILQDIRTFETGLDSYVQGMLKKQMSVQDHLYQVAAIQDILSASEQLRRVSGLFGVGAVKADPLVGRYCNRHESQDIARQCAPTPLEGVAA